MDTHPGQGSGSHSYCHQMDCILDYGSIKIKVSSGPWSLTLHAPLVLCFSLWVSLQGHSLTPIILRCESENEGRQVQGKCLRVLLLLRDAITTATFTKKKKTFTWGLAYCFRDAVHFHHGREHSDMQRGMVLECS